MRAQVGRPDGVTNASIAPETSSTPASPSAIPAVTRPCRANARPRVPAPGSIHVQPSRSPAPAATNTAVSSSRPWGTISPRKRPSRPFAARMPPTTATLTTFWSSTHRTGSSSTPAIRQVAATNALFVHTCAANDAAGFEE